MPITYIEMIAEPIATQQELDAYVGRTGADLAAEGYEVSNAYASEGKTKASACKGGFDYSVMFDGVIADEPIADYPAAVADMKVLSIEFSGLSWRSIEDWRPDGY